MNSAKLFFGIVIFIFFIQILKEIIFKPIKKNYYENSRQRKLAKLDKDMKTYLDSIQIRK